MRAGLGLINAVGELPAPQRLQVRVGIAMGVVVVGDLIGTGSAQEQAIVGETPNLAARLQAARRAKYGGDCREHAPADRQPVRSVRSRAAITQGLRRAAAGLACVGGEPRARPVRGAPLRRYPRRSIRRHQRGGRSGCVPVSAFSVGCVVAAASAVPGSGSEDCGSAAALACSSHAQARARRQAGACMNAECLSGILANLTPA